MSVARIDRGLLGLFTVVLLAVGVRETLRSDWWAGAAEGESSARLLGSLSPRPGSRLEVRVDERREVLQLDAEGWQVVEGPHPGPAHQPSVEDFLAALSELGEGRVVAPDLSQETRFGFGELRGMRVVLRGPDGAVEADLHVGAMDARGSFLRRDDEARVRKLSQDFSARLRPRRIERFGWRDDTILDEGDPGDIRRVVLEGPSGRIVLERDEDEPTGWRQTAPKAGPAETWICDLLVEALARLQADRFYEGRYDAAGLGLEPPDVVRASAEWQDGRRTVLEVGSREVEGLYPVRRPGTPTIWLIPRFRGSNFRGGVDSFLVR